MTDVSCGRIKLKPGSLERVREWAKALNERSAEALDTMRNEGCTIESVFLDPQPDGDYLIYYMRVEDYEKARDVFKNSTLPIDVYHKQFKQDTWAENKKLDLLVDFNVLEEAKNNAYAERNCLVTALSKLFSASLERHPENEEYEDDWRWIVFVDLPTGQVCWHIHDSELPFFAHLPRNTGRKWDGHDHEEKYRRVTGLTGK